MKKLKVKGKLCREFPMVVSDLYVTKTHLQFDLHAAQMKVDVLQKEVRLKYLAFCFNFC